MLQLYQMTLDELKKRERKKEQNRRAALRSRKKQTDQESEIIQVDIGTSYHNLFLCQQPSNSCNIADSYVKL